MTHHVVFPTSSRSCDPGAASFKRMPRRGVYDPGRRNSSYELERSAGPPGSVDVCVSTRFAVEGSRRPQCWREIAGLDLFPLPRSSYGACPTARTTSDKPGNRQARLGAMSGLVSGPFPRPTAAWGVEQGPIPMRDAEPFGVGDIVEHVRLRLVSSFYCRPAHVFIELFYAGQRASCTGRRQSSIQLAIRPGRSGSARGGPRPRSAGLLASYLADLQHVRPIVGKICLRKMMMVNLVGKLNRGLVANEFVDGPLDGLEGVRLECRRLRRKTRTLALKLRRAMTRLRWDTAGLCHYSSSGSISERHRSKSSLSLTLYRLSGYRSRSPPITSAPAKSTPAVNTSLEESVSEFGAKRADSAPGDDDAASPTARRTL